MPVQFVSPLWDIWRWSAGQARTMVRRVLRVDTSYIASVPCHKAPAAMNSNLLYALSAEHLWKGVPLPTSTQLKGEFNRLPK
jgi:hypothetical protein